jgi:hypothetical protein
MAIRIRFNGAATLNSTITLSWLGGYPPSATASAIETFKTTRALSYQTSIAATGIAQATNYYNAIILDYNTSSSNFAITRIDNDVIINPLNGTNIITATTSSANIVFNPTASQVTLIGEPQAFVPAYNPITYRFFSTNYSLPGYRYLFNIVKPTTQEVIGKFKVAPQIDGTGYIDISKILSNFLTYDFEPTNTYTFDCKKSYLEANCIIGEEYSATWLFNQATTKTGTFSGYTILTQTGAYQPHTYVAGDQLNITTTFALTDPMSVVNGLHTVLNVISAYSIVIDAVKPSLGTFSTSGIVSYADGRKTQFNNIISKTASIFNGVRTFNEFPNWDWTKWYMIYGAPIAPQAQLLTSLRISSETYLNEDDHFYMTTSQAIFLNFAVDKVDNFYLVAWYALSSTGNILASDTIDIDAGANGGHIKQVRICPDDLLSGLPQYILDQIVSISFYIDDDSSIGSLSRSYQVWLDKRCKIERYELYFMDRMGSILSFACQLRAKETGTITRESGKRSIYYNELPTSYSSVYNLTDVGTNVNAVNMSKELELNTDWMNNEMSLLFDELLTSPFVWLKTVLEATNELPERIIYNSVTISDTSFEVQKQKNKRLIRKTVRVKMANEDIINI